MASTRARTLAGNSRTSHPSSRRWKSPGAGGPRQRPAGRPGPRRVAPRWSSRPARPSPGAPTPARRSPRRGPEGGRVGRPFSAGPALEDGSSTRRCRGWRRNRAAGEGSRAQRPPEPPGFIEGFALRGRRRRLVVGGQGGSRRLRLGRTVAAEGPGERARGRGPAEGGAGVGRVGRGIEGAGLGQKQPRRRVPVLRAHHGEGADVQLPRDLAQQHARGRVVAFDRGERFGEIARLG